MAKTRGLATLSTEQQQKIADTYFDKSAINTRIGAALVNQVGAPKFAPYVTENSPYYDAGTSNIANGTGPNRDAYTGELTSNNSSASENGAGTFQSVNRDDTANSPANNGSYNSTPAQQTGFVNTANAASTPSTDCASSGFCAPI